MLMWTGSHLRKSRPKSQYVISPTLQLKLIRAPNGAGYPSGPNGEVDDEDEGDEDPQARACLLANYEVNNTKTTPASCHKAHSFPT